MFTIIILSLGISLIIGFGLYLLGLGAVLNEDGRVFRFAQDCILALVCLWIGVLCAVIVLALTQAL